MNVQQQIARLESLLARIQRNAGRPRPASAATPEPAVEARPPSEPPDSAPPTDRAENFDEKPTAPPLAAAATAEAREDTGAEVEELDMGDDELVEIAVETVEEEELVAIESPLVSTEVTFEEERPAPLANELAEEPAPESAPRPAAQVGEEADLEPPVKTPPPESGRQVVAAPVGISGEMELPEVAAIASLEPDLSGRAISEAPEGAPSASQLGETVELEGADGPPARIELLSAPMNVPPQEEIAPDDLEMSLPQKEYGGGYDAELAPPSRASEDLARHRQQVAIAEHPPTEPPVSLASPVSVASQSLSPVDQIAPEPGLSSAPVGPGERAASPILVGRPSLGEVTVTEMRRSAPPELPDTFLALLDTSLSIEA